MTPAEQIRHLLEVTPYDELLDVQAAVVEELRRRRAHPEAWGNRPPNRARPSNRVQLHIETKDLGTVTMTVPRGTEPSRPS